jgi:hypothetical protein
MVRYDIFSGTWDLQYPAWERITIGEATPPKVPWTADWHEN